MTVKVWAGMILAVLLGSTVSPLWGAADVVLTKTNGLFTGQGRDTDGDGKADAGDVLQYTVTVDNHTSSPLTARILDTLPHGLGQPTFISGMSGTSITTDTSQFVIQNILVAADVSRPIVYTLTVTRDAIDGVHLLNTAALDLDNDWATSTTATGLSPVIDNPWNRGLQRGEAWLTSHVCPYGAWTPFSTAWVLGCDLRALLASGESPDSPNVRDIIQRLEAIQATDGSWGASVYDTAVVLGSLTQAGVADPGTFLALKWLRGRQALDGGFWDTNSTGLSALAFAAVLSRDADEAARAIEWLKSCQNADGYWGFVPGDLSNYTFYYPHIALAQVDSVFSPEVARAADWIYAHYDDYGNWPLDKMHAYITLCASRQVGRSNYLKSLLKAVQNGDGGWGDGPGWFSSYGTTVQAVQAMGWEADLTDSWSRGLNWLKSSINPPSNSLAELAGVPVTGVTVLALDAVGRAENHDTIATAVGLIEKEENCGWCWDILPPGQKNPGWGTCQATHWGLRALAGTGLGNWSVINSAVNDTFGSQNADGGWGTTFSNGFPSASEVWTTCLCLLGLQESGKDLSDSRFRRGMDWLRDHDGFLSPEGLMLLDRTGYSETLDSSVTLQLCAFQSADGSWWLRNTDFTGNAILALRPHPEARAAVSKARRWLQATQNSDGGWSAAPGMNSSNTASTAWAVWALAATEESAEIWLEVKTDKASYGAAERVTITVTSGEPDPASVKGNVVSPNDVITTVTFSRVNSVTYQASYDVPTTQSAGTFTVAATVAKGTLFGSAVSTFNVASGFGMLRVTSITPSPGSRVGQVPKTVVVSFNQDVSSATVNVATLQLVRSGGDGVFGNNNDVVIGPRLAQSVRLTGPRQATFDLQGAVGAANDTYQITVRSITRGRALRFDGVDDYVVVPPNQSLEMQGSFTLETWAKVDSYDPSVCTALISKKSFMLYFWQGTLGAGFFDNTDQWRGVGSSEKIPVFGIWHHFAVAWDGVTLTLLVDGEVVSTANHSGRILGKDTGETRFGLVAPPHQGTSLKGGLDEIRVWNVARTPQQIRGFMNKRLTGAETGLVGYWPCDEGQGQNLYDLSLNDNHGTLGSSSNADAADPLWAPQVAPVGTLEGDGVRSAKGDVLDGEFLGVYPSGDGQLGGDFVSTFTIGAGVSGQMWTEY